MLILKYVLYQLRGEFDNFVKLEEKILYLNNFLGIKYILFMYKID